MMNSDELNRWTAITCEFLFPFLAVMGIVGNSITLFVILSRSMRSSTNEMLAVAAACDILYIICMTPNQLSRWPSIVLADCGDGDPFRRCPSKYHMLFAEYKHNLTFLVNWFSAASTWCIVAVSFDRLYAIKAPFSARTQTVCSRHNLIAIPMIFLLTGASCFHLNFKLLDDHDTSVANGAVDGNGVSIVQVLTILMLVFHILIPMFFLITLHTCLLYYLRNRLRLFFPARRGTRSSTRSDEVPAPLLASITDRSEVVRHHSANSGVWNRHVNKAERHVTYTVIAIVSCYIISHIPSAVLYVYINLFHDALYTTKWMYTSVQLSTTVVTCSKVANFILFCMSSKHFRKEMRKKLEFLVCKKKEGISQKDSGNQPKTRFRSLPLNIIGDSTQNISREQ